MHYRWMEFMLAGNKLQRCRTAFLDSVGDVQRVLIVGEGNGRFLTECRRKLQEAQITCLDASARMLGLARRRVEREELSLNEINFVHSDLFRWNPPPYPFDLVVTHFFLDCFSPEELGREIELLAGLATPDARWLLADFQLLEAGFHRYRAQAIHWLMYAFFRRAMGLSAQRLTPPDDSLRRNGLRCASDEKAIGACCARTSGSEFHLLTALAHSPGAPSTAGLKIAAELDFPTSHQTGYVRGTRLSWAA